MIARLVFAAAAMTTLWGQLAPTDLQCEYLKDPIGIDTPKPRFFWVPRHTERSAAQTAYQIDVKREGDLDPVWDSGKVASAESTQVVYAGPPLQSATGYGWRVRYWDQAGRSSPYSPVAIFDMGLLSASDWRARWIRGENQMRKEFSLDAAPLHARAYVAGVGYYELRLNGRKVGDHVLDSPYTSYDKRILYSAYNVTPLLHAGVNAVGVMLGEGWFHGRAAIVQIEVEMPNGRHQTIVSDETWKAAQGPIVSDSVYNGETYDARLEIPNWDLPNFDDSHWQPVSLNDPPKGVLSAQMMPPIRAIASIMPVKITNPKPGVFIFDMGQNFSGWTRLKVRGLAGTEVKLRHAELLYGDGTLNVENLRSARATDTYILKGSSEEIYEPRFTYHGFRYVELTGFPGTPRPDTILARVVHSDVKPIGGFSSSKQIFNQIQQNILWGITSNLESIPTDCNQRDERMGWLADAHLYAETAMLNFDMPAFYTNFLRNIRDSQADDGSVPDTVPRARFAVGPADPAWGSAYPLLVLYMYQRYGDRRVVEENFDGVRRWTDFLGSRAEDGIVSFSKYGDWVPLEKTPGPLVSTFYYYWSAEMTAHFAEILGKKSEAGHYRSLADEIKAAFQRHFYNPETGAYANGTQTSYILPLFADLAPKENRGKLLGALRDNIIYSRDTHLATGILGTKYLFPLLTETGESDLAYDLAAQTSYPSWGFMIARGATTLWELWQDRTGSEMNSHNHPMFASIGAWFYEALAGINFDDAEPGYRHIRFAPQVVRDLNWASGSLETVRGAVSSSWTRSRDSFRIEITVPVGSTAEVDIPKLGWNGMTVKEGSVDVWKNGKFAAGAPGISSAQETLNAIVFQTGSGSYVFEQSGK
jgi:alpha-L-rhamnosidase